MQLTCNLPGGGLLTTFPFLLFSSNDITNAKGGSIFCCFLIKKLRLGKTQLLICLLNSKKYL